MINRSVFDIREYATARNFNEWLHTALTNKAFTIVGGWDNPAVIMSDDTAAAAMDWLMVGNVTADMKAEFIFDAVLDEGSTSRAALLFDCMKRGDFAPLIRRHVVDLIENGGHLPDLLERIYGPDTRPKPGDE